MDEIPSFIFLRIWLYFFTFSSPCSTSEFFFKLFSLGLSCESFLSGRVALGYLLILRNESLKRCLEPLYAWVCQLWASMNINLPWLLPQWTQKPVLLAFFSWPDQNALRRIFQSSGRYHSCFRSSSSWLMIAASRECCQNSVSKFLLNLSVLIMCLKTFRMSDIFQFRDSVW